MAVPTCAGPNPPTRCTRHDTEPWLAGEIRAQCDRAQAEALLGFDHHRVQVEGRVGVLLTYHWMERGLADHHGPFVVRVVLRFADRHPAAPERVQHVVDALRFVDGDGG